MEIAELRDAIWNYLFEAQGAKTLEEIAAFTDQDASAVNAAVEHEWFSVAGDQVSIAYATGSTKASARSKFSF